MAVTTTNPDRRVKAGDIIDSEAIATLFGLASPRTVSTIRSRRPDFPAPIVQVATVPLWVRADVVQWAEETGRRVFGES